MIMERSQMDDNVSVTQLRRRSDPELQYAKQPPGKPIAVGGELSTDKVHSTACAQCRESVQQCDGGRPACQSCVRLGLACSYEVTASLATEQPIHDAALACCTLFDRVSTIDNPKLDSEHSLKPNLELKQRLQKLFEHEVGTTTISLADISDEFDQFVVWTKNLGVFASDNASLDYRLRDAPQIKDGILLHLKDLADDLGTSLSALQDNGMDHGSPAPATSSDASESDSDSEMGLDEWDSLQFSAYQVQDCFRRVSDIVTKLMELAELIRSSSAPSRASRAGRYEPIVDGINQIQVFQNDYLEPLLRHKFKVPEYLMDRLCKAIALRRRRFMYQAAHQKRLAFGERVSNNFVHSRPAKSEQPKSELNKKLTPKAKAYLVPTVGSSVIAGSKASTFRMPPKLERKAISAIVSAASTSTVADIKLPKPPIPSSETATHFECPYCCVMVPVSKRLDREWRQHFIADLQPFVCVEPECPTQYIEFESRSEWLEHQRREHALRWWCDCSDDLTLSFDTQDAYIDHLAITHAQNLSLSERESRSRLAAQSSQELFSCCPFCNYAEQLGPNPSGYAGVRARQKNLQNHIANELLRFFLLALPERDDDENNDKLNTVDGQSTAVRSRAESFGSDYSDPEYAALQQRLPSEADHDECEKIWTEVWESEELLESVRRTYAGPEQDKILSHITQHPEKMPGPSSGVSGGQHSVHEVIQDLSDDEDDLRSLILLG